MQGSHQPTDMLDIVSLVLMCLIGHMVSPHNVFTHCIMRDKKPTFYSRFTLMIWVIVLLHLPASSERQPSDSHPDNGKLSMSRGSKDCPNHDDTVCVFL